MFSTGAGAAPSEPSCDVTVARGTEPARDLQSHQWPESISTPRREQVCAPTSTTSSRTQGIAGSGWRATVRRRRALDAFESSCGPLSRGPRGGGSCAPEAAPRGIGCCRARWKLRRKPEAVPRGGGRRKLEAAAAVRDLIEPQGQGSADGPPAAPRPRCVDLRLLRGRKLAMIGQHGMGPALVRPTHRQNRIYGRGVTSQRLGRT